MHGVVEAVVCEITHQNAQQGRQRQRLQAKGLAFKLVGSELKLG